MSKKKVLIVDDKDQIAKILYVYLQGDYDCHYKPNPLAAIQWLSLIHISEPTRH